MEKTIRFTLRVSPDEKEMIQELAQCLKRKQSYAVRYVIRKSLEVLKLEESKESNNSPQSNAVNFVVEKSLPHLCLADEPTPVISSKYSTCDAND